jgi:cytochrome c oxidase subunit 2
MSQQKKGRMTPRWLPVLIFVLVGGGLGLAFGWQWSEPVSRDILIKARQYAYEPSVLKVNAGDTLRIRLVSLDVVHGFYVEGHDVDAEVHPQQKTFYYRQPSQGDEWEEVEELTFVAGRPGKYRYRCSHTCGSMHPFMLGELIVEPNLLLHAGIGSIAGMFVGMVGLMFRNARREDEIESTEIGESHETQV